MPATPSRSTNEIAPIGRLVLLACVLAASLSIVPTGLQAQDAKATLRLQILADEERTEKLRLEEARKRFVDRTQARDAVGAREAEAAIGRHEQNLKALATELGAAERTAQSKSATQPQKTVAAAQPATSAPAATSTSAAPTSTARWWDVYDRPTAQPTAPPAVFPPSQKNATADAVPARATPEPFQPTARRLP